MYFIVKFFKYFNIEKKKNFNFIYKLKFYNTY